MDCQKFYETRGFKKTGYFGNIKGKNEYRQAQKIVQIGINRPGNEYFLCLYFAYHKDQYQSLIGKPLDEQEEIIKRIQEDPAYWDVVNRYLLSDLEQNLFRGRIREYEDGEQYEYVVLCRTSQYQGLINQARERFGRYGTTIVTDEAPAYLSEEMIRTRGNTNSPTVTQMILGFLENHKRELFRVKQCAAAIGADPKRVSNALTTSKQLQRLVTKKVNGLYEVK